MKSARETRAGLDRTLPRIAFLILIAGTGAAHAQVDGVVWGYSWFQTSTTAKMVVTYSATEIDYAATDFEGYCPYVAADLYDETEGGLVKYGNSGPNAWDCSNSTPGSDGLGAERVVVLTYYPPNPGDDYLLNSEHFADAVDTGCYEYDDDGDCVALNDPLYFSYWSGRAGEVYGSGSSWLGAMNGTEPEDLVPWVVNEYIAIATTQASLSTSAPNITLIQPVGAPIGTSGTLTIGGTNLIDPITQAVAAWMSGTGVTLTPKPGATQGSTQIVLTYQVLVGGGAARGARDVTVSNRFGASETTPQSAFTIGDPTPTIASVSPGVWAAGGNDTFTVTGTGFGSNPQLTLAGPDLSPSPTVLSPGAKDNGTAASTNPAQATVIPCTMGQPVSFTAVSSGYDGTGFVAVPSGPGTTPTVATATKPFLVTVATPAPAPQIWFQNSNVSNTNIAGNSSNPQAVVVGQLISLSNAAAGGRMSLPPGCALASQSWTISGGANNTGGTVIGGWAPNANNDYFIQMQANTGASYAFYWVDADATARQVKYNYTMSNGQPNSVSAYFSVVGPVGTGGQSGRDFFTATLGAGPSGVNVFPPGVASNGTTAYPMLEFGNGADPGIVFTVTATPPVGGSLGACVLNASGCFQWVQLINSTTLWQSLTNPPTQPGNGLGTGLDNWYPYATVEGAPNQAGDFPGLNLTTWPGITAIGERAERFSATMYLMWDPALPGPGQANCHAASTIGDPATQKVVFSASTCGGSTPVPLGFMNWGFYGDAINTLVTQPQPNGTTWLLNCGTPSPAIPVFQRSVPQTDPNFGYPSWTSTAQNSQ